MNADAAKTFASLLLKSGDVNAAHICHVLFGCGMFGPEGSSKLPTFELLGSDKSTDAGFGRDLDSILLSLVMEFYKVSTEPVLPTIPYSPHLVLYKLVLTSYLADLGNMAEAQHLFDSVNGIVKAAGKNISYNPSLFGFMEFVGQRLTLIYQDDTSSSWLSSKLGRPKLDRVLGQLDKSFSKFVTGEVDTPSNASTEQDGIFKRLADSPSVSRVQSTVELSSMAQQTQGVRAMSYGGNPYAPMENKVPQPHPIPSRSQSSVGFHNNDTGMLSPPNVGRFGDVRRAHSPSSYGPTHDQIHSAFNTALSTAGDRNGHTLQSDMRRPRSANISRRSSLNTYGQDNQPTHGYQPDGQGLPPATRSSTGAIHGTSEEQRRPSAPGSSPLKNQVASTYADPYTPGTESAVKSMNPYAPPSSQHSYSPYAPQQAVSSPNSSVTNGTSIALQQGRRTPVTAQGRSNSVLSPRSAASLSRPSSRLSQVSAGLPQEQPIAQPPLQQASQTSSHDSLPGVPQAVSQSTHEKDFNSNAPQNAPRVQSPVSTTSSVPNSTAPTTTPTAYNPYAPTSQPVNPYAQLQNSPKPAKSSANPYTPSSRSSVSSPYAPATTAAPSSTQETRPISPAYGGYDPYGSIYGYSNSAPKKEDSPVKEELTEPPHEETDNESAVKESQNDYEPYEAPEYGYQNDGAQENDPENLPEPSGEIFAPMGAPTFMPAPYDAPPASMQSNESQNSNTVEEEEEIEDLGFSNNSSKKAAEEKAAKKEEEKKEEHEKKGGWFSWLRKGHSDEKKAVQIKFGDDLSLAWDPVLKRYVDKNAPKEDLKPTPKLAPPPPSTAPPGGSPSGNPSAGPPIPLPSPMPTRSASAQPPSDAPPVTPPSEGTKSARQTPIPLSGGSLDDLLAAAPSAGTRKGARRPARSRYVDIMSQK